jgi:hypothetical protein
MKYALSLLFALLICSNGFSQGRVRIVNTSCTDVLVRAVTVCKSTCTEYSTSLFNIPANSEFICNDAKLSCGWQAGYPVEECENNWEWWYAEYSQACVNSTGIAPSGCWTDINGVGRAESTGNCGLSGSYVSPFVTPSPATYGTNSCAELSSPCGTCSAGAIINGRFSMEYAGSILLGALIQIY